MDSITLATILISDVIQESNEPIDNVALKAKIRAKLRKLMQELSEEIKGKA